MNIPLPLTGIELTQGIQNARGGLALVAGKDLYLRVFVSAKPGDWNGKPPLTRVRAELTGAGIPRTPGTYLKLSEAGKGRDDPSGSTNVLLPGVYCQGTLGVKLELVADGAKDPVVSCDLPLPFKMKKPRFPVFIVPIEVTRVRDAKLAVSVSAPDPDDLTRMMDGAARLLPLPGIVASHVAPALKLRIPRTSDLADVLVDIVPDVDKLDQATTVAYEKAGRLVGVLGPGWIPAQGMQYLGMSRAASSVVVSAGRPDAFAHELAHGFGLRHTWCKPDPKDPEPIENGSPLKDGHIDEVGFGTGIGPAGSSAYVTMLPKDWFDYMCCGPHDREWSSAFTWDCLQRKLKGADWQEVA